MTNKLQLSLGCIRYDRTRCILDGSLEAEGIDLRIKEIVDHDSAWLIPIHYRIFDVAEMPLVNYVTALADGNHDLIALPIFLSRSFRHSTLYINTKVNIQSAKDLEGKRIGIGNYFGSTTLWVRGLLSDRYQVDLNAIQWVTKTKVLKDKLPPSAKLKVIDDHKSMEQLLEAGEIDAYVSERPPTAYKESTVVSRLFENYKTDEVQYYRETNIFPIRHVLVVNRKLYERQPWIAQSLFKLFNLAKQEAAPDRMFDGHSRFMLPSLQYAIAETKKIFGEDCWPYGLEKNNATLKAFFKYCHDQGYTSRHLNNEDIFTPHFVGI